MFQLKKGTESFTVVDGPFAGRTFEPGKTYAEIPPQDADRFEEIREPAASAGDVKPAKADKQRAETPSEKSEVK